MKKFLAIMLVVALCLPFFGALAQTAAEFNQECWVKIGANTTLYQRRNNEDGIVVGTTTDLDAAFEPAGTLNAGTYVKITSSLDAYGLDAVSYFGGSGYVKSSAIVSAVTTVKADDGSSYEVPEAVAADPNALIAYLNSTVSGKTFSVIEGSSVLHVEKKKAAPISNEPAVSGIENPDVWYMEDGGRYACTIVNMGLVYTDIMMNGQTVTVPTANLAWDTKASAKKVIGVINMPKSGEAVMRTEAKKKAPVMDTLPTGTVVCILKTGGSFTRVFVNGHVGFVATKSIKFYANKPYPDAKAAMLTPAQGQSTVDVLATNKKKALVVDTCPAGTPVTIIKPGKTWTEIELNGLHCYVLSACVQVVPENAPVPAEATPSPAPAETPIPEEVVESEPTPVPEAGQSTDEETEAAFGKKDGDITVGIGTKIDYGSYKQNNNYNYSPDYQSDERYFFDEEY